MRYMLHIAIETDHAFKFSSPKAETIMAPIRSEITNEASLDAATAKAINTPTLLYIYNSSLPIYKNFTPTFEEITSKAGNDAIAIYYMDYSDTTSSLMKFAPNQMPVLVVMYGENWCRTIIGGDRKALERLLGELREKAGLT